MISPREYREHLASKRVKAKQENVEKILSDIKCALLTDNCRKNGKLILINLLDTIDYTMADCVEVHKKLVSLGWEGVNVMPSQVKFNFPEIRDF